jgi:hypothetical protein
LPAVGVAPVLLVVIREGDLLSPLHLFLPLPKGKATNIAFAFVFFSVSPKKSHVKPRNY